MLCEKCGLKNADDAEFCTGCGSKLKSEQDVKNTAPTATNPNGKKRMVIIIAVAVIAVIVVITAVFMFGGNSSKTIAEKYFNASFEGDAEAIIALLPEEVLAHAMEEEGYDSGERDEFIDEANEGLQEGLDYLDENLGEGWVVSYEIINVEDVLGDSLDDLKDDYEEIGIEVSAANTVEIQTTVKAGETEQTNTMDVSVIKVGRSWYLDYSDMF